MTDTVPALKIEDLRIALPKGSDRPYALDGLSLEVKRGEVVCLVGESGSGKSLTAGAIMRLLPEPHVHVAGGAISVQGQDMLSKLDAKMVEIGDEGRHDSDGLRAHLAGAA